MLIEIMYGFFFSVLFISFEMYFIYAHERTHARIYENAKINYKISFNPLNAYCDGEKETKETIRDHNMTEIIGYHAKVLLHALIVCTTVIVSQLI